MFSTVLERLTTLLSKYFLISAFFPVAIFAFIVGAILYRDVSWFRRWTNIQGTWSAQLFDTVAVLVGIAAAAYLLSSISTVLRQILEGKYIFEKLPMFCQRQEAKRTQIVAEYSRARDQCSAISYQARLWRGRLKDAADAGIREPQNTEPDAQPANPQQLHELEEARQSRKEIDAAAIEAAVEALERVLRKWSENAYPLAYKFHSSLMDVIDYAGEYWRQRETNLFAELQSRFSLSSIAPTSMGNVALSMQSYTSLRYGMNLELFWTRLQPVIVQSDKDFFGQLQDAKAQLESLVACCGLSVFTTLVCLSALAWSGRSLALFLGVAAGGPLLASIFYLSAVQSYRTFADLVRTSVDLYRTKLLSSLGLPLPRNTRDERLMWSTLERLTETGGEYVEMNYVRKADTEIPVK